jgi:hypothetical protein
MSASGLPPPGHRRHTGLHLFEDLVVFKVVVPGNRDKVLVRVLYGRTGERVAADR